MASRWGPLRCHTPSRPTFVAPVWPHLHLPRVAAAPLRPHTGGLVCTIAERAQRCIAQADCQTPRRPPGASFPNCSTSRTRLSSPGQPAPAAGVCGRGFASLSAVVAGPACWPDSQASAAMGAQQLARLSLLASWGRADLVEQELAGGSAHVSAGPWQRHCEPVSSANVLQSTAKSAGW